VEADLDGSMAYARALARAGIITAEEANVLQDGLAKSGPSLPRTALS